MRTFFVVIWLASLWTASALARPNDPTPRPAPPAATDPSTARATLARARKVHLVAPEPLDASNSRAFEQLRAALDRWRRFTIVDRPDRADVTVALSERQVQQVAFGTNAPVGAALVNPKTATVSRHLVTLTLRRASTGDVLWRAEAATVQSVIEQLQQDAPIVPTICIAVWCR